MNKISVIIVTFNNERTIKECLSSLVKFSPDSEIIVVDNGSTDLTLKIVRGFQKRVTLIEAGHNLGFAKGNNLGVKAALGEYLVFLNPDAILTKAGDLEHLRELMEKNPECGLLGPKLIYPDKTPQPRVRNLPTIYRAFKEYILDKKGAYAFYEPRCQTLCSVESISGACMMIRKELFERVGGFDEKYFMYYEDLQICRCVRARGYKVGFVPEVTVEHAEGVSGQSQKAKDLMQTSARKYFGFFSYYFLELIFFYNRLRNRIRRMLNLPVHA